MTLKTELEEDPKICYLFISIRRSIKQNIRQNEILYFRLSLNSTELSLIESCFILDIKDNSPTIKLVRRIKKVYHILHSLLNLAPYILDKDHRKLDKEKKELVVAVVVFHFDGCFWFKINTISVFTELSRHSRLTDEVQHFLSMHL